MHSSRMCTAHLPTVRGGGCCDLTWPGPRGKGEGCCDLTWSRGRGAVVVTWPDLVPGEGRRGAGVVTWPGPRGEVLHQDQVTTPLSPQYYRMTDACKNITFAHFATRAINICSEYWKASPLVIICKINVIATKPLICLGLCCHRYTFTDAGFSRIWQCAKLSEIIYAFLKKILIKENWTLFGEMVWILTVFAVYDKIL